MLTEPIARASSDRSVRSGTTVLLARVRDVQPGKAHALSRGQQFWKRLGVQAETSEIDALVDAAQPVGGCFLFVHRGRAGRVDAGADEA